MVKIFLGKGFRKQVSNRVRFELPIFIGKIHGQRRRKIHQHLPARAARRTKVARTCNNQNRFKLTLAFAQCFEERDTLGAHRQRIR